MTDSMTSRMRALASSLSGRSPSWCLSGGDELDVDQLHRALVLGARKPPSQNSAAPGCAWASSKAHSRSRPVLGSTRSYPSGTPFASLTSRMPQTNWLLGGCCTNGRCRRGLRLPGRRRTAHLRLATRGRATSARALPRRRGAARLPHLGGLAPQDQALEPCAGWLPLPGDCGGLRRRPRGACSGRRLSHKRQRPRFRCGEVTTARGRGRSNQSGLAIEGPETAAY
jgi:hypothetical protein